jgi:bifunctional DNA-binding transcriptional regulator/antitoxin component of YhaV-PrlF toxin-antitoxin module
MPKEGGMAVSSTGLIRGIARVDSEGRIPIPKNILTAAELREEDAVELRLARSGRAMKLMISKSVAVSRPGKQK